MSQSQNVLLRVKPLSVNEVRQWKRFKTKSYKNYELLMFSLLPDNVKVPNGVPLRIEMERGFWTIASDITNPTKPLLDILSKKYGFNDKYVFETLEVKKVVWEWNQYIHIKIIELPVDSVQFKKK